MTSILITGAGRGLGHELARQAMALGWTVHGSVRHAGSAPAGVREMLFDVRDRAAIVAAAAAFQGALDILINNAGVIGPTRQSVADMDAEGFATTLAVNTIGPVNVVQAFLSRLERSSNARVITLSSWMGSLSHAKEDRLAYRASKAAANRIVRGMATELRPRGITVTSMHPGWVRTDMGGSGADISPAESAAGILAIADRLTLADTDRFMDWQGQALAW